MEQTPNNAIYITVGQTLTAEEFEEVKQTIIDGGHVVCGAYEMVDGALSVVHYSNFSFVNGNKIWFQFLYVSFEDAGTLLYVDYCTLSASGWGSKREYKFPLAQDTPAGSMLEKVKLSCRVTTNAYDVDLNGLIDSAKVDLGIAGVELPASLDAICERAIITYCKLHFLGLSENECGRLKASYDEQKAQLVTASGYTDWGDVT